MTDTATKILIVAGMANVLIGALAGIPMALARQSGAATAPRYLTMVHLGGLMHGPILLGIGFALTISTASPWVDTTAAVILAAASGLLVLKDLLNWLQGVEDEFTEHSIGLTIGKLFGPVHLVGLAFASASVVSGL